MANVCEIDSELKMKMRKFRFRKEQTSAAIVMKIDKAALMVKVDEEYDDISVDELAQKLPTSQPRYISYIYKYEHKDGTTTYSRCFIFYSPEGCVTEMSVLYGATKGRVVMAAETDIVFNVHSTGDITQEWLEQKLGDFQ